MAEHGAAKWQEIADALCARIAAGELATGDRLHSAYQLSQSTGAAISTVRRAVSELQAKGVLRGVPGVGVFVVGLPDEPPLTVEERLARLERAVFGEQGPPRG